ncbi:hypothetical protein HanRHA438_Chr08g0352621 [Helianthus annuus]|uniref:Uncharacterized protein n=1 Tax=Helianthus annuus TaxID=4232 RepID=A0A9K3IEQ3_HELAN|nr:hypothetical protein HanXRQr2_Chr08g0341181 [Helianthus annuus]KAJ0547109.1 hypothetical protein HanIR_Chr08g0368441 [Helianthus annuus]KAJ0553689.1 hypothetical protein HanHA89_Chr08g0299201 [Helianthus annuus]KAJ0722581.1 hypothetical protein HanOQP8_Chr08g0288271 [Helianthus annuus]KAJ0898062.1 hypothetical protein HanRHA438_Chr08g0352621 [Helianthus annuus]
MFWVYRLLSSLQTPFRLLVCGDGSCLMLMAIKLSDTILIKFVCGYMMVRLEIVFGRLRISFVGPIYPCVTYTFFWHLRNRLLQRMQKFVCFVIDRRLKCVFQIQRSVVYVCAIVDPLWSTGTHVELLSVNMCFYQAQKETHENPTVCVVEEQSGIAETSMINYNTYGFTLGEYVVSNIYIFLS